MEIFLLFVTVVSMHKVRAAEPMDHIMDNPGFGLRYGHTLISFRADAGSKQNAKLVLFKLLWWGSYACVKQPPEQCEYGTGTPYIDPGAVHS